VGFVVELVLGLVFETVAQLVGIDIRRRQSP
jgi:hypothetical protein